MRKYFLAAVIWIIYKLISMTWRFTFVEPPDFARRIKEPDPMLLAHWHGDEMVLMGQIGRYRVATITSTSKDGEIMDLLVHMVGGVTSRGSSTRGAVSALKGLVRLVKTLKRNSSFAVDGPKGPIYKVKPGIFELSRLINAPIFFCGVACDRAWKFERSWNKTFLPKPFAKVVVWWSENPMPPITRDQDPRSATLAETLENALHNQRALAFKKIAAP